MPKQLWNEGRVVGYSAYEMYVRHALSIDPNHEPASEKEWLASMMSMGSSMLLRIGADPIDEQYDGIHYRDIQFPENTRLCAANTIMASLFIGDGLITENASDKFTTSWTTRVIDYGPLIYNNSKSAPNGNLGVEGFIPPDDETVILDDVNILQIKEYMKIVDGIIIQPGTWIDNPNKPPQKDFTPTLSEHPRLRIAFSERVVEPFFLLLIGFTNRSIVGGVTGFDTAINTQSSQDGDFLGPWAFPWANKVIFSIPPLFMNYYMKNNYTRKLPSSSTELSVSVDPIVDMETTNPSTYYNNFRLMYDNLGISHIYEDPAINIKVSKLNTINKDAGVLAIYRYPYGDLNDTNSLPGALYGAKLSNTGNAALYPIDTVAPGTLKIFHCDLSNYSSTTTMSVEDSIEFQSAINIETYTDYNYSFLRDNDSYVVSELKPINRINKLFNILPISDDRLESFNGLQISNTAYMYPTIQTGSGISSIKHLTVNINVSGYVTQDFMTVFTMPYISNNTNVLTCKKLIDNLPSVGIQHATVDQIPENYRSDYNYAIVNGSRNSIKNGLSDASTWILPIKKLNDGSGYINIYISTSYSFMINGNEMTLDLSTIPDYVGTWWGSGSDSETASSMNLENHPTQKVAINYNAIYYQYGALTPKPPNKYGYNFLKWFKQTSCSNIVNSRTCSNYNDINPKFKQGSIYDFLKNAVMYDLGTGNLRSGDTTKLYHFFNIAAITDLYEGNITNIDGGHNSTIIARFNYGQSFFVPATIGTQNEPINNYYLSDGWIDTTHSIVTSVGQSGLRKTKSISLLDLDGVPLNLTGNEDDKICDKLTWQDLMEALNFNQSIDVLGADMRQLRDKLTEVANIVKQSNSDDDYVIHIDKDTGNISLKSIHE